MTDLADQIKNIPNLKFSRRGKVREIYEYQDKLLMVASDRISCFDVVLPTAIPQKGTILTKLSEYWFDFIKDIIPNHLITANVDEFPQELLVAKEALKGRCMLTKKAQPLAFECVVRGYLSGSGWAEYKESQTVCGEKLPEGLCESDKLPNTIFTPATKEEEGHDMNVSYDYMLNEIGEETASFLRDTSIAIYEKAAQYAETKGIIIADTKFEFGWFEGKIILIDEVLTPDSSRFWPKDQYAPGQSQPSFDKQYVRDYLLILDWDKTYPGPDLPDEIVKKTYDKYHSAFKLITGKDI
ncbi:MAG: phosphoribosylaminoimidazolesuccinocarboxamide synthase [Candidatus Zapsychrus exili]|nr:phosphoribosylaminoimidazolesuccinocarboxamide synthase [Candidatus Zapsychrus exili]